MFNLFQFLKNLFRKPIKNTDWHDGLLPSPVDYRDLKLGAIQELVPAPKEYQIPYKLRVHFQGIKPICAGESGSLMKEEKERRERNFIDFDGEWLYNEAKKIDGMPNVQGTYFRAILKVLYDKGGKPLGGSEADAALYKIGGYAQVDCSVPALKSAIYQNGVILAGFEGSNEGWKTAFIRPPKSGENIWGHAVGNIGFTEQFIDGQNSWGENWGDKGLLHYNEEYLPFEAWAILVDRPNIPETIKPHYQFNNNLVFGMANPEVKILQECLKSIGCFPPETDTTGYFGEITLTAVKNFQQRYGISQTGYVGPTTRQKLNGLFLKAESNNNE